MLIHVDIFQGQSELLSFTYIYIYTQLCNYINYMCIYIYDYIYNYIFFFHRPFEIISRRSCTDPYQRFGW